MKSDATFSFPLTGNFSEVPHWTQGSTVGRTDCGTLVFYSVSSPSLWRTVNKTLGWWIIRWKTDLYDIESLMSLRMASYIKEPSSPKKKYINNDTLIPWSRVLPGKNRHYARQEIFPICGIYMLISVIKNPCHWPKFWFRWIQFCHKFLKICLHILFPSTPSSPKLSVCV